MRVNINYESFSDFFYRDIGGRVCPRSGEGREVSDGGIGDERWQRMAGCRVCWCVESAVGMCGELAWCVVAGAWLLVLFDWQRAEGHDIPELVRWAESVWQ